MFPLLRWPDIKSPAVDCIVSLTTAVSSRLWLPSCYSASWCNRWCWLSGDSRPSDRRLKATVRLGLAAAQCVDSQPAAQSNLKHTSRTPQEHLKNTASIIKTNITSSTSASNIHTICIRLCDSFCFVHVFDFIECFTTTFLRAHSWLNWVEVFVL